MKNHLNNQTLSKISQTIIDIHNIARDVEYEELSREIRMIEDTLAKAGNIYYEHLKKIDHELESSGSNTDNR
jgi:transposase-like protein